MGQNRFHQWKSEQKKPNPNTRGRMPCTPKSRADTAVCCGWKGSLAVRRGSWVCRERQRGQGGPPGLRKVMRSSHHSQPLKHFLSKQHKVTYPLSEPKSTVKPARQLCWVPLQQDHVNERACSPYTHTYTPPHTLPTPPAALRGVIFQLLCGWTRLGSFLISFNLIK